MNMLREFLLGFIKIHILYHADKEGFCGVDMMKELKRHGYSVGPGTLYPILHRLQTGGYLRAEKKVVHGKVRIYYRATEKGISVLTQARPKINELISGALDRKHLVNSQSDAIPKIDVGLEPQFSRTNITYE